MASAHQQSGFANNGKAPPTTPLQTPESTTAAEEKNQAEFVNLLLKAIEIQNAHHKELEMRVQHLEAKAFADADPALQDRALKLHAEDVVSGRQSYSTFESYLQYARTGNAPQQVHDPRWNSFPQNVYQAQTPSAGAFVQPPFSFGLPQYHMQQGGGQAWLGSVGEIMWREHGWSSEDGNALNRALGNLPKK